MQVTYRTSINNDVSPPCDRNFSTSDCSCKTNE